MITTEQATNFLSNIDSISHGGCLISAYAFFLNEKRFDRHHNLQISAFSYEDEEYSQNKAFIEGATDVATATSHFGWTYDGGQTNFDCNGEIINDFSYILLVPFHLTESFCVSSINNGNWNSSFNREENLPKIIEFFDLDFSNIRVERNEVEERHSQGWWFF